MYDRETPVVRYVRMRVGRVGFAVRRPARVTYAESAVELFSAVRSLFELGYLAFALDELYLRVFDDGDTARIIAPVLEPFKPVDKYGRGLSFSDVTDYSAHEIEFTPFCRLRQSRCYSLYDFQSR